MGQDYEPIPGLAEMIAEAKTQGFMPVPYRVGGDQAETVNTVQTNGAFITNQNLPFLVAGEMAANTVGTGTWAYRLTDGTTGVGFSQNRTPVAGVFGNGFVPWDHAYYLGPSAVIQLEYQMLTGSSATLTVQLKGVLLYKIGQLNNPFVPGGN